MDYAMLLLCNIAFQGGRSRKEKSIMAVIYLYNEGADRQREKRKNRKKKWAQTPIQSATQKGENQIMSFPGLHMAVGKNERGEGKRSSAKYRSRDGDVVF
jgi:hypothetical protein